MLDYNCVDWKSIVEYDESSPSFLKWKIDIKIGWRDSVPLVSIGDVAGRKSSTNYYKLKFNGSEYRIHRIIWILHNGYINNKMVIDHIDGNSLNNMITNLRLVTRSINSRNLGKRINNSSGVLGVHFSKRSNSYVARWLDIEGNWKSKSFSRNKYGSDEALNMAINHRKAMLLQLNSLGAGYTDRHIGIDES